MIKNYDILILGAGAAGLFTAIEYEKKGFKVGVISLEDEDSQTINSQGIIHSGTKYKFYTNNTSNYYDFRSAVKLWNEYLAGTGNIDLTGVKIISHHCTIWPQDYTSLAAIQGAKVVFNSVISTINTEDSIIKNCGKTYTFHEKIIDPRSLITVLLGQFEGELINVKSPPSLVLENDRFIKKIIIDEVNTKTEIKAEKYIFCCGNGNNIYWNEIYEPVDLQTRPLYSVKVTGNLPLINGHVVSWKGIIGTITSRKINNGINEWSLGGNISESHSKEEALSHTYDFLEKYTNFLREKNDLKIEVKKIIRAEGINNNGKLPEGYIIHNDNNFSFCWPIKLVLTPLMAMEISSMNAEVIKNA